MCRLRRTGCRAHRPDRLTREQCRSDPGQPVTILDEEDVRVVLETNVTGAFNMTRAVAPHMISRRAGKIVNISSVAGEKGGRGQTNYAASKGALNAFTRSLAVELAPRGITVNAVAPGVIETEMSREVRERAADQVLFPHPIAPDRPTR